MRGLLGQRFWMKVQINGIADCWTWTGARSQDGYGHFSVNRRTTTAQRVAWVLASGDIPTGMHVLHTCDNRLCVNPRHLWIGTNADNVADRVRKGRSAIQSGENNPRAVLNRRIADRMRRRYARGGISQRKLSKQFGVSKGTVYYVVKNIYWAGANA